MFGSKFHPLRVMSGAAGLDIYNGGGKGGDAPAQPDYVAAAKATAEGNLANTRAQLAANRVNQVTPYGGVQYTQSGTDQYGNPTYTATQNLSPEQQNILKAQQGVTQGALNAANAGMGNVQNALTQGSVDMSKLPSYGINPGETYSDAIMRRLQPQMAQDKEMFDSQMANQGIAPGTQAYENAARVFQQGQNDKQVAAITGGMNVGLNANQQAFGQAQTNLNTPVNLMNAVRQGSQVTNPSYVNPASMGSTAGPDYSTAAQQGYNAALGNYNAQQAAGSNYMSGLMGLGNLGVNAYNAGILGSLPLSAAGTGSGLLGAVGSLFL